MIHAAQRTWLLNAAQLSAPPTGTESRSQTRTTLQLTANRNRITTNLALDANALPSTTLDLDVTQTSPEHCGQIQLYFLHSVRCELDQKKSHNSVSLLTELERESVAENRDRTKALRAQNIEMGRSARTLQTRHGAPRYIDRSEPTQVSG